MVRGAGMSRGCAACRRRKIKCDESQPECARCLKSGKKCPGSVIGAVFLAYDGQDSMKSERIEHDNEGIRRLRQSERELRRFNKQTSSISAITSDIHVPDPSHLLETQLRSSFISFFTRSGSKKTQTQSWLGSYIFGAEDASLPGWRESVLAATLALYGAHEQNQGAIAASHKWYHRALCFQRRNMRTYADNSSAQVSEINVSMAVILAYSEVILPTHPRAFSQHIKAAAALLQILGPEACTQATLHALFRTIRLYMIYEAFDEWTTSAFTSSKWIHGPFQDRKKRLSDHVIDLLFHIPGDMVSPLVAVGMLQTLWHQLVQRNPSLTPLPQYTFLEPASESWDLWNCVPDTFTHTSSETAVALALYSFGWVVSLSLLNQCGDHAAEYAEIINGHCETILDAAAFVSTIQDGCGYIRMTPPLRTVLYYSSNPNQRERATGFMRVWGKSINLLQTPTSLVGQSWLGYNLDCNM